MNDYITIKEYIKLKKLDITEKELNDYLGVYFGFLNESIVNDKKIFISKYKKYIKVFANKNSNKITYYLLNKNMDIPIIKKIKKEQDILEEDPFSLVTNKNKLSKYTIYIDLLKIKNTVNNLIKNYIISY